MEHIQENLMSITANELKMSSPVKKALNSYVITHIKAIEAELKNARVSELESIKYNMEYNFNIPNTSNTSAQRYIFSSIISQLENNGFNVLLVLNPSKNVCYFKISWYTPQDKEEHKRQEDIIRHARQKTKKERKIITV